MATKKPTTTKLSPHEADVLASYTRAGERIAELAFAELATVRSDKGRQAVTIALFKALRNAPDGVMAGAASRVAKALVGPIPGRRQ